MRAADTACGSDYDKDANAAIFGASEIQKWAHRQVHCLEESISSAGDADLCSWHRRALP